MPRNSQLRAHLRGWGCDFFLSERERERERDVFAPGRSCTGRFTIEILPRICRQKKCARLARPQRPAPRSRFDHDGCSVQQGRHLVRGGPETTETTETTYISHVQLFQLSQLFHPPRDVRRLGVAT